VAIPHLVESAFRAWPGAHLCPGVLWLGYSPDRTLVCYAVFRQLRDQLEAIAGGLDGMPAISFVDDSYSEYQLFERTWPPADPGPRVPIGVTLGMNRNGVLSGKPVPRIYVGVRVETSYPGNADLHGALLAALAGNALCEERPMSTWPCWRWIPMPSEHWWEDRDAFEQTLATALVDAWNGSAPVIREVLQRMTTPT
jgi:hypothetical protein